MYERLQAFDWIKSWFYVAEGGNKVRKIYTIMVMTDLTFDEKTKCTEFGSERLVGWYSEFEDAYSSVSGNSCDINETCYKYALIEECEEGLYNPANKRWWFEYSREKDHYFQINEPDFIKGFCGFTIG